MRVVDRRTGRHVTATVRAKRQASAQARRWVIRETRFAALMRTCQPRSLRATSASATSSEFDLISTVPCLLRAYSTRR